MSAAKRKANSKATQQPPAKRTRIEQTALIKDSIIAPDGRVFYPCQYCNRVFPIKKARAEHAGACPAKDYILSIGDSGSKGSENSPRNSMPQKSPPIKMTIKKDNSGVDRFKVADNNTSVPERSFDMIAKMLKNNQVTMVKTGGEPPPPPKVVVRCKHCNQSFPTEIALTKHIRQHHNYPKILLPLAEIRTYYDVKDRSKCPICGRPLATKNKANFIKHLNIHSKELNYSCSVCDKQFRRIDHMRDHEKRHIVN